ncbi:ATP-binding protein [Nostoc sp. FACHB-87]|uniref:ATP-binding protein n=1 Tax=Nostocaceae TaxID=1162 RepID=UPI00168713E5|nr:MULTISPECIES: ATP-binding protein [Nostocaceae]MBD2455431.1 ATP-binding protein [Nostoc sp. FACHB-87]MBD2475831.1 ATP-binding protein [Anabaena sp. FACHB-83]
MNLVAGDRWQSANHQYLVAALAVVRETLEQFVQGQEGAEVSQDTADDSQQRLTLIAAAMTEPPALEVVCNTFDLSDFERDVLLLCAGMELDAAFPRLCAEIQGREQQAYPTFSLALTVFPDAHLSAIAPSSPLLHWRLIEVEESRVFTLSPLRLSRWALLYLTGMPHLDRELSGLMKPLVNRGALLPSYEAIADQLSTTWVEGSERGLLPIVQLCGEEVTAKWAIAATACEHVDLNLYRLSAQAIPQERRELETFLRLWQREVILSDRALLVDCDGGYHNDVAQESALHQLLEEIGGIVLVSSRDRRRLPQRPSLTIEVSKPTPTEQQAIWKAALGERQAEVNGQVEALVAQFDLSSSAIAAACIAASSPPSSPSPLSSQLWDICRLQSRPRLEELAQRIEPAATWEELVLPEAQRQVLRDIAVHVRQRSQVYDTWGFRTKGNRGLGISALFAGSSGTGKTMAAEVLARELRLDLYRIDLSSVVSKYIGETEKNLRRVFDAAESSGVILLFDEADALFGKRSEVKDSRDRHANIEVSYLLQRMEAYRGLAILTTNLKDALDQAFLRRIRFIVQFPFPDLPERVEIWRHIFPAATPTEGLEVEKLAQLNVAGGNIRNIAMNAAFLAAEAKEAVQMSHVLQAAKREYAKLEKSLTDGEIRGWVK